MNKYPHLFSPITIRNHTYRNRIITGPTMFAAAAFMENFGEAVFRMVARRAQGGAGAVTTGEMPVNQEGGDCFMNAPVDFSIQYPVSTQCQVLTFDLNYLLFVTILIS